MEKKYEIVKIEKNKKAVYKNLGLMGIGTLLLGAGIVGMRYFGEGFFDKLNSDEPLHTTIALLGYLPLTGASLITSVAGGCELSESIPKFKDSVRELKKKK